MANDLQAPTMYIVAGAPGSGKSTLLPVASFGVDFFNADDHAAKRNGGSYHAIPQSVRDAVNLEFAAFITDHIRNGKSLALETTLRTDVALKQAREARASGFVTKMTYIGTETVAINLKRVIGRAKGGGHSAPESTLRSIHAASYQTLWLAIDAVGSALNELTIVDNTSSAHFMQPAFQLSLEPDGTLSLGTAFVPAYLQPYWLHAKSRL